MTPENIKAELVTLISTLFKEKGFEAELIELIDLIDDVGMDSITFVSMVVEVEAHFGIEVPDDYLMMDYFKTVDSIVKIIEDELSKNTKPEGGF